MVGNPSSIYQEWLANPWLSEYWDAYNPNAEQYARMELPVLSITGVYDDDQTGALEHYRQHVRHASAAARVKHYLVIGPWDHAGTGFPRMEFGGLKCGPASLLDIARLHLEWYAWTMRNATKPSFLQKLVAYYVMGAERWRYADTLEEITSRHETLYLDSDGSANDIFASGSMSEVCGTGREDVYIYDPRKTDGPEVEAEEQLIEGYLTDQTAVSALSGCLLVYHSKAFDSDTEISGFFRLCAWIAIDRPDTDLYASVFEIGRNGNSVRLATDGIRARHREDMRKATLIDTGEPLKYDFNRFTFMSRKVKRGHRLRLVICPFGRLVDAVFTEKNYNIGGVVAQERASEGRPVTVKLFHTPVYPSALYIPFGRSESRDEPQAPASWLGAAATAR
jgi:putative CocE/NonD family hydrolase